MPLMLQTYPSFLTYVVVRRPFLALSFSSFSLIGLFHGLESDFQIRDFFHAKISWIMIVFQVSYILLAGIFPYSKYFNNYLLFESSTSDEIIKYLNHFRLKVQLIFHVWNLFIYSYFYIDSRNSPSFHCFILILPNGVTK